MTTTICAMINRHAELHRQLDRLYAAGGDNAVTEPAYGKASQEAMLLEYRVIAERAFTKTEALAKRSFVNALDDLDVRRLVEAIFELDDEAVSRTATKPNVEAKPDAMDVGVKLSRSHPRPELI